ncbi:MAG: permease prefix domain 1-containing protein [Micrococcales bacterium]|nr:permease prefix domain 1-containing protein [Micrococcales bacterium]
MTSTSTNIHRLLDDAFAGADATAEVQELKEELRANLMARVAELVEEGTGSDEAARRAFYELGDVSALLGDVAADPSPVPREKVRPPVPFVARVTIISTLVLAIGVAGVYFLTAKRPPSDPSSVPTVYVSVEPDQEEYSGPIVIARAPEPDSAWSSPVAPLAGLVVAALVGFVVADVLRRETTTRFGMPRRRAAGYGTGTGLLLFAVLSVLAWFMGAAWWVVFAGALFTIAGIGLLAALGATQTNRTKPWARPQVPHPGDRFEAEPETAARFGIYTLVVWVVGAALALVLGITAGWLWAVLALVGAFVAMMLLLTRMLFTPR